MKQLELELTEKGDGSGISRVVEDSLNEKIQVYYKIPGMTESPTVNAGMLKRWIRDFHEWNDLTLPKGFHGRKKNQLLGMYYGMLKHYGISEDDIVPQREEFY